MSLAIDSLPLLVLAHVILFRYHYFQLFSRPHSDYVYRVQKESL
jgi:hypothetical protein